MSVYTKQHFEAHFIKKKLTSSVAEEKNSVVFKQKRVVDYRYLVSLQPLFEKITVISVEMIERKLMSNIQ